MEDLKILPFGACNLMGPLTTAIRNETGAGVARVATGGSTPSVYSFGEMRQLIAFLRGTVEMPAEMRGICQYPENYTAVDAGLDAVPIDAVLVEPNATVDFTFNAWKINRAGVFETLTNPFKALVPEVQKPMGVWYNKGILAMNEEARAENAAIMADLLPRDFPDYDLMIEVIRESRGTPSAMDEGFEDLLEIFGRKIGVMVYTYQYLPDGRAISWPSDLLSVTEQACARYDLPLFKPFEHVVAYGAEKAIREDGRHYSDEFRPVIAQALTAFARQVAGEEPKVAVSG